MVYMILFVVLLGFVPNGTSLVIQPRPPISQLRHSCSHRRIFENFDTNYLGGILEQKSLPLNCQLERGSARRFIEKLSLAPALSAAVIAVGFFGFQSAAHASLVDAASSSGVTTGGGFLQAFLLIFISEIGDKTFFIAALLAAKYGRLVSFTGSIGALGVMTLISTALGQAFHAVPASITQGIPFDDIIAVLAFAYFGVNTLIDASKLDPTDSSGIEEEKAEAEGAVEGLLTKQEKRAGLISVLAQTFSLVFAAEIGDRSFLSTIALSAALNPFSVAGGAIAAHAAATGIAVIGGSLLSKYLSEKVIGYIGGTLFIAFAITTAAGIF